MKIIKTTDKNFKKELKKRTTLDKDEKISKTVAKILKNIKKNGDEALLKYTRKLDGILANKVKDLRVCKSEMKKAFNRIPSNIKKALEFAHLRIKKFHQAQLENCIKNWSIKDENKNSYGQIFRPIERVGVYVPGGSATYPSSLLMNVVPAVVCGVKDIVVISPISSDNDIVLATAYLCGVEEMYKTGGAHGVSALAFGTESLKAVDKITGPGNAYVAEAKRQLFGFVGIDMVAGPSEVLIIADKNNSPFELAIELFAQAEHDIRAQAILISDDEKLLEDVQKEAQKLINSQKRKEIIAQSLENRGMLIKVRNMKEALEISNLIAPEHLELAVEDPNSLLCGIQNAGCVFMGKYSCQVLGDYCAGPNHTLPTSSNARFCGPLSVSDFCKSMSLVKVDNPPLKMLDCCVKIANCEGLHAHAMSADIKIKKIKNQK